MLEGIELHRWIIHSQHDCCEWAMQHNFNITILRSILLNHPLCTLTKTNITSPMLKSLSLNDVNWILNKTLFKCTDNDGLVTWLFLYYTNSLNAFFAIWSIPAYCAHHPKIEFAVWLDNKAVFSSLLSDFIWSSIQWYAVN